MKNAINFLSRIFFDFCLLILLFFLARLFWFSVVNLPVSFNGESVYYFFYIIWIIIIFSFLYILLLKEGFAREKTFSIFIILVLFGFLSSEITGWLTNPNSKIFRLEIVKRNYIGLSGLYGRNFETNGEEDIAIEEAKNFVFVEGDYRLPLKLSKIEMEYEYGSKVDHFIFWQTAFIAGFNPYYIPSYHCCDLSSDRIELYVSAVPLVLLECFIDAIYNAFLLLILALILRMFGRHLFFEDLESLKEFVRGNKYIKSSNNDS